MSSCNTDRIMHKKTEFVIPTAKPEESLKQSFLNACFMKRVIFYKRPDIV